MEKNGWDRIAAIPRPNERRIAIWVTKEAEHALRRGHPWLFDQSIRKQSHSGRPGDLAVIFNHKRNFLAIGLYDPLAPIRVRILQARKPVSINSDFFASKLQQAAQVRANFPSNTTGYRLVYGENDGLPGLVIDRYDQTLVIKIYTLAWLPHLQDIVSSLQKIAPHERIVLRLSRTVSQARAHFHG